MCITSACWAGNKGNPVTASKVLGAGFAGGNEAQLMIYLQEAHLMAAVKEGNVAEVRRLVEQEEVDVNSRSYVSCTLMDIVYFPIAQLKMTRNWC